MNIWRKKRAIYIYLSMMFLFGSCGGQSETDGADSLYHLRRQKMVDNQIVARGITDKNVIAAMRRIPRHLFVPKEEREQAYSDGPLPIGHSQTISQPYIVAIMTELLGIDSTSKVLEIGTGSGYQAAVLGEIADSVYTIEIVKPLAERAAQILDSLGYKNIFVRAGDGYQGWPEAAPFDAVIVTAAAPKIPQPLIEQLKTGGRLVIPVGELSQELYLVTKNEEGIVKQSIIPVRFVPMTGEVQKR
jgi:protein-L-isoaspartate(D-aspartate) O-methyltransferase